MDMLIQLDQLVCRVENGLGVPVFGLIDSRCGVLAVMGLL